MNTTNDLHLMICQLQDDFNKLKQCIAKVVPTIGQSAVQYTPDMQALLEENEYLNTLLAEKDMEIDRLKLQNASLGVDPDFHAYEIEKRDQEIEDLRGNTSTNIGINAYSTQTPPYFFSDAYDTCDDAYETFNQ
jgi:hypothetical protein